MEDKERFLRRDISSNIGDIIEGVLTKNPQFDNIPIHTEASKAFYDYCRYEPELPADLKSRFIRSEIVSGRFFCKKKLLGHGGKPFAEKHPEHMLAREEFWHWVKLKEKNLPFQDRVITIPPKKAEINKCVKQVIKKRFSDFKIDNKAFGSIGYSRKWGDTKIYILADTGSWRSSLCLMLGIDYPKFCMDIACFFGGHQSDYGEGYLSIGIVEEATNKALDLIEAIMPFYLNAIESAFTANGLKV